MLKIQTDNKFRPVLYGLELSKEERKDFDHFSDRELDDEKFFRYRKTIYSLSDFTRIYAIENFKDYDGYFCESAFSGVLVKLSLCGDAVKTATYMN